MLFVQGCGFGWLYMRIGDSKRIAGLKLLSFDTQANRFDRAQAAFHTALGYYQESILYDELSNPEVYHKQGFTNLMIVGETPYKQKKLRSAARKAFLNGLKKLRFLADQQRSNRTAEMLQAEAEVRQELGIKTDLLGLTPIPEGEEELADDFSVFQDADYARCHAGLGEITFLEAISSRDELGYKAALFHYMLADRTTPKRARGGKRSFTARVLDFFNLEEINSATPFIVEVAKVHNFMALRYRREGNSKLEQEHFRMAKEALDQAKNEYPDDSRVYAEDARLAFYQRDYQKAQSAIRKVLAETRFYADKREFKILQGQIFNEMKEADKAQVAFQWVLDHEPAAVPAIVGRGMAAAIRKDRIGALADIATIQEQAKEDPFLMRQIADIHLELGDRIPAAAILLKAFYKDRNDIELVFKLGKLKYEMNEITEAKDLLKKVIEINPTSEHADEARQILARAGR